MVPRARSTGDPSEVNAELFGVNANRKGEIRGRSLDGERSHRSSCRGPAPAVQSSKQISLSIGDRKKPRPEGNGCALLFLPSALVIAFLRGFSRVAARLASGIPLNCN